MELFSSHTAKIVRKSFQSGFTLIEMIVVVLMIGIIFVTVAVIFNPQAQINRAQNASRQHDLDQIKAALDSYMSDTGCYPTAISFGYTWATQADAGGQLHGVYMAKVPEDPLCGKGGTTSNCYVYQTDTTSSCPQWNVLYAKLASPLPKNVSCPLQSIDNCIPSNFSTLGMNYCVISGKTDCSVSVNPIAPAAPTPPSAPTATPTPYYSGPTPTPTPAICAPGKYYACTGVGPLGCNNISPDSQCKQLGQGGSLVCYCSSDCTVNTVDQCH